MAIIIRPAHEDDVVPITDMVNGYAAQDIMLPRREESVRATLPDWLVAIEQNNTEQNEEDGQDNPEGRETLLGCGSLVPLTETLVEIRSLAIAERAQGKGVGSRLVRALVELAREQEFEQVCALTMSAGFFTRLGFNQVDRWSISPKVWQACIYCSKFHRCDEVAVLMNLVANPTHTTKPLKQHAAWQSLLRWEEWQPLKLAYQERPEDDETGRE